MSEFVYTLVNLRKNVNGRDILKGIYLSFLPGAKIGILGNNGSGKSTLLKIMAGVDKDFSGEAFAAKGLKIGFLPQEPVLDPTKTVLECVEEGVAPLKELIKKFEDLNMRLAEDLSDDAMQKTMDELSRVQDEIDAKNAWEMDSVVETAMRSLDCPPGDQQVVHLSGGERRRVALCQLVLSQPDLLLLDEPTNHLDADSVAWLEQYLQNFKGTVVAVTHDRYFLDNAAGWILELDRGAGIPWKGNYSSWLDQKTQRLAQEEKQESARQRTLKHELEWVRMNAKARQAKSKARLSAYEKMASESYERVDQAKEIAIPPGPRLGDLVIRAEGLAKSFGQKTLFTDLHFNLPRGGIVGIIGANGAGKSTLFKILAGAEKADAGALQIGETVQISYVDQNRESLNNDNTVVHDLAQGNETVMVGNREVNTRSYLAGFGFKGVDQTKTVGVLSGGERNRFHLAKLLLKGGNLLLLDEPTNDLDVDTLRALEEGVLSFPGCAVVISHDRWFLDRICTHMLAFEGNGKVVWFEGNYQDYVADKKRRSH